MDIIQIYAVILSVLFLLSATLSVYDYIHSHRDGKEVFWSFIAVAMFLPLLGRIFNKW